MLECQRLGIIGLGLIGGSLAKACKQHHASIEIIALEPDVQSAKRALADGVVDQITEDIETLCQSAEVIVIAVPPTLFQQTYHEVLPHVSASTLMMDVTSVKHVVLEAINHFPSPKHAQFVMAHPMCGRETAGYINSDAMLFKGQKCIVSANQFSDPAFIQQAKQFWQALSMHVIECDPSHHDSIVSAVSHLPHALAFSFLHCLSTQKNYDKLLECSGTGFKDFTRIGKADASLWTDICLANQEQLLADITVFEGTLDGFKQALAEGNKDALHTFIDEIARQQ